MPDQPTRWARSLMPTYGEPALTLVRGDGAQVWDDTGRGYLDLFGGVAVNALGHAHPAVVRAVTEQIATLGHVSNFYATEPAMRLAETLLELIGLPGKVFLCNSGTEAVEAAFKIARRTGRTGVVAAEGAFHGRTLGALSLTGQPEKRAPFQPLVPGVTHVPFGDTDALRAAVDGDTAAVILEPILGEAGVIVPPEGYLSAAREICTAAGALLILDEVQTGIGRTGSWFGFQRAGVTPDVITLAKALGGGLPIGACVGLGAAADLLGPGQHGSTFGGNPVSCAAALAVLRTVADDGLLQAADLVGKELATGIEDLAHPLVDHVRGAGLLLGIGLTDPVAARVADQARADGFLVNVPRPDTIRLAPPLVLTTEQARTFVTALPGILDRAGQDAVVTDPAVTS